MVGIEQKDAFHYYRPYGSATSGGMGGEAAALERGIFLFNCKPFQVKGKSHLKYKGQQFPTCFVLLLAASGAWHLNPDCWL